MCKSHKEVPGTQYMPHRFHLLLFKKHSALSQRFVTANLQRKQHSDGLSRKRALYPVGEETLFF